MQIESGEVTQAQNPFSTESTTERILAYGERAKELSKLQDNTYSLIQKIADNKDYIANLSKKKLNQN